MIQEMLVRAVSAVTGLVLPAASSSAVETDSLLLSLIGGSIAVVALVFSLMLLYLVRYRHGSGASRAGQAGKSWKFEIAWTAATLAVFFGLFIWGADLYVRLQQPPEGTLRIAVTGKQWMWKAEHPGGQAEINALHVPLQRPVELLMTSEDVIHDFSIPAFRIKHDVLPGRYQTLWFTPTRTGTFRLFCTQFCGTDHSVMGGEVVVLEPAAYERWLATSTVSAGLVEQGRALFGRLGCGGCHRADPSSAAASTVRAPALYGLYGSPVALAGGTVVVADDQYIRDSIIQPGRQVTAGYEDRMPSYAGAVDEGALLRLVAYVKSLGGVR